MALFNFEDYIGQTISTFDVAVDTLLLAVDPTAVTVATSGANLVITTTAGSVTLSGIALASLTTTNVQFFAGTDAGVLRVGDNDDGTDFDGAGNTVSITTNTNNQVWGLGGADNITLSGTGDNLVYGGADGDTVSLGSGQNTVKGGAGNDTVSHATAVTSGNTVTFNGAGGNDSYTSGTAAGTVIAYGGADNDTLNADNSTGTVSLFGGAGADTLTTGDGNATVDGGADADDITTTGTGDVDVSRAGGAGADTINAGAAGTAASTNTTVTGGAGADIINFTNAGTGNGGATYAGDFTFNGNGGNDTVTAGTGTGVVSLGNGNDSFTAASTAAAKTLLVTGGAGNDTFTITTPAATALISVGTGEGDDSITITNSNGAQITVTDFAGADDVASITGSAAGADAAAFVISGSASSLTFFYDANSDGDYDAGEDYYSFTGLTGDFTTTSLDVFDSGAVQSQIITSLNATVAGDYEGGTGSDQFYLGNLADTVTATAGDDKVTFGTANNVIQYTDTLFDANSGLGTLAAVNGGAGTDSIEFIDAATIVDADFNNGVDALFTNVEKLVFGNFASQTAVLSTNAIAAGITTVDATAMTTGTNTLGLTVSGYTTGFTASFGAGNDSVTATNTDGTTSGDSLDGGAGNDTFTFAADDDFGAGDTVVGGSGTADIITLGAISSGTGAVVDSAFTNVTTVEKFVLINGAGAQTATFGAQATEAGIVTIDGSAETGHQLTIDASAMTTGVSIVGGDVGDSLVGGTGADTISNGVDTGATVNTITGGTGADTFLFADNIGSSTITDFETTDYLSFSLSGFGSALSTSGGNEVANVGAAAALNAADLDGEFSVVTGATYADYDAVYAAISGASGTAGADVLICYADTDGKGYIYFDADFSDDAAEVLIATIEDITDATALSTYFATAGLAQNLTNVIYSV